MVVHLTHDILKNFIGLRSGFSGDHVRESVYWQYMNLLQSYEDGGYPTWLGNGLSLFYSNARVSKKHAEVGKMHRGHRRALGEFRAIPLPELFAVDRRSAWYRDPSRRELFDAQSWALVHFMLIGRSPEGSRQLARFLDLLRQGSNDLLAFQKATGMTIDEIEADVARYVRKRISQYLKVPLEPLDMNKDFRIAELDAPVADARLGQFLISIRRMEDAEQHLGNAVEADPELAEAYEGLGYLAFAKNDREQARGFFERAVNNGASGPTLHFLYAQTLVHTRAADGSIPQPGRQLAMASLEETLSVAPDHAEAAQLYGFVCLFEPEAYDRGISAVETALESHRGATGLLFILGQLYTKTGVYQSAKTIFEALLKRDLDASQVAVIRWNLDLIRARTGSESG